MLRYGFTIRTRMGQRARENAPGSSGSIIEIDAERRLGLECRERSIPRRFEAANAHMIERVENVSIIAASQIDAERRLRQMYVQCEILECRERSIPRRFEAANAHMIDLRAISPPTIQHMG